MKDKIGFFALSSLKNRLFLAFLLLILLPYSFLQLHSINTIERSFERQIIGQNTEQLEQLKITFEDLRSTVFRIAIRLEKDPAVTGALNMNLPVDQEEIRKQLTGLWNEINSKILPSPYVFYTLMDRNGNQYSSYSPKDPMTYDTVMNKEKNVALRSEQTAYLWVPDEASDLRMEDSKSPRLLTLYLFIHDEFGGRSGLLRIGIDFQAWLSSMARSFPITQDFFLVDGSGIILGGTGEQADPMLTGFARSDAEQLESTHRLEGKYLYNRMPVPAMKWTLVSRFPIQQFFGDVGQLKRQTLTTFLLFTLLFVVITFFILSTIIRPLRLLQKKMAEVADKQLVTYLHTGNYKGEVLLLAKAFNQMISDLQALMQRLKAEERQKEAVRFQVLLSQMNPHFLLNTLNVVKWNVLGKGDEETAAICVSLGKLLETSLNDEADLVHFRVERELTEAYVSIQSFRYDQSFEIRWECDEGLAYALVPKLSLQPLVENAIFHGLSSKGKEGIIWIRATVKQNRCYLEVEDNGAGWDPANSVNAARKRKGIGLKNMKERLELLFKQQATLEIHPLPQGTRVRLGFPLLIAKPYQEGGIDHVERAAR
ncbi:sensor histidine kinase [Paenibacillus allorhizosphaerae]|uniref:HAMP domain-containing protein n=1 Tax=Paenibacillus allorhizosphaerae TaxID=2849866 RepID=A0ABM8VAY3_9BACL|nr:sensor histidine kinase [Paenibacillus allorhizosphaerae]CAG7617117.1 hypothetical protein PAECIP111802_00368 [Paenibacillus allorhizosphaerae]